MKILFVYNNPLDGTFGGSQRTIQNLNGLKLFAEVDLFKFEKKNKLYTFLNSLMGYIGNSSIKLERQLIKKIRAGDYDYIFFDQAIYGIILKHLSRKTVIPCIVHYHNNEEVYYRDLVRVEGLKYLSIYLAAKYNQYYSKKFAAKNLFITKEDAKSVGKTQYEKIIIPITLKDIFSNNDLQSRDGESYILFVGAATFANVEGAKFIIRELAPVIDKKFVLIGTKLKTEIEKQKIMLPDNVAVYDYVDNLKEYFLGTAAFISPLYFGSGMKVKLAEAMMYGKKIIGTPLSYFGYEVPCDCKVCHTAAEFKKEIASLNWRTIYYKSSRIVYEVHYSSELDAKYYAKIFAC